MIFVVLSPIVVYRPHGTVMVIRTVVMPVTNQRKSVVSKTKTQGSMRYIVPTAQRTGDIKPMQ